MINSTFQNSVLKLTMGEHICKLVIVGDGKCGKTSILTRIKVSQLQV